MTMNDYLNDKQTKGLISIMENLQNVNRQIAVVYSENHNEDNEIEDDSDYMAAQLHIQEAIRQIGQILGNSIAEKFF